MVANREQRCRYDHKHTFTRYARARSALVRLNDGEGQVYWCARAGGWHITRYTQAEYQQRKAVGA